MKKLFFILCLASALCAQATQYYVAGNGSTGSPWCDGLSWKINGSKMTMNGNTGTITFQSVPVGSYEFKVTDGVSTWYGIQKYSATGSNLYANGADNVCFSLQQTQDVTISFDGSKICLNGSIGNDTPDPSKYGKYGVQSEYEGVMLQAFYWNSYVQTKYSNTKWNTLTTTGMATDIAKTFDLVWLPPCGEGGGVGYYCKTYSNLSSDWGTKGMLKRVIDTLHTYNCKVLADVVINHRQSASGWAKSFTAEDFGTYGQFQITSEHICAGDEAFTNSSSDSKTLAHGAADTGDNDGGCRDLDHTSTYVQDYIKAYVQWLLNTIGFDGFRYDMVKGYAGQYVSMYNQAANPYFSVAEYWDGAAAIKNYLESASYNTTCFDFPLKYKFNDWKGGASYSYLKNPGMRGLGLSKYAVTFIDNHDTFERSDNQSSEFLGYNVVLSAKAQPVLEANAYLLMMPGTPCVFWPHWYTYTTQIKQLVALRKAAGIHSESAVSDETSGTNTYSATITGHHGSVVLRMGSARATDTPSGYFLAIKGDNFDIYASQDVQFTPAVVSALGELPLQNTFRKEMRNGQLVIIHNNNEYDIMGRKIQ